MGRLFGWPEWRLSQTVGVALVFFGVFVILVFLWNGGTKNDIGVLIGELSLVLGAVFIRFAPF